MRRFLCVAACIVAAFGLAIQSANAQSRVVYPRVTIGPFDLGDTRIIAAAVIAGGAATGAYFAIKDKRFLRVPGDTGSFNTGAFALTTVGCMTIAPMIAAAIVWHTEQRPLTNREAQGLGIGCIIPVIGSMLVDAAYDAHPEWPR